MAGLSLNRWLSLMGFHPWLSMQLTNSLIPLDSKCNALMLGVSSVLGITKATQLCEYIWQDYHSIDGHRS